MIGQIRIVSLVIGSVLGGFICAAEVRADSAIDLLSGFDESRIESAYPLGDEAAVGELAKMIYRLKTIREDSLRDRLGDDDAVQLGDAVQLAGELVRARRVSVPDALVEFLEFTDLFLIDVTTEEGTTRQLVCPAFPRDAKPGDGITALGVVVDLATEGGWTAMAASRVQWSPRNTSEQGWQLLSDAGFDVALLAGVQQRSRQPLVAQDGDGFYSMLAAARQIGKRADNPKAASLESVELLSRPEGLTGKWLSLVMETVQITRIAITDPARQDQLGQDHYFQIDAVVDLGEVIVKIERPDPSSGPPAIFENRYPVSVVAAEIPVFLQDRIRLQQGGEAVVSEHRSLIAVDGFFYRLWSYESEFMSQNGGGDQFGPLLVAAKIMDRTPNADDPIGVRVIGWVAAVGVVAGILFFWVWSRLVAARDRDARRLRRQREADQVQLPG
ncbi:MAG: hypothetical protein P8L85_03030 [Rubripirellula sp.]|nr:hypothetical protein [Rubripirellula sp.]